MTPFNDRTEAGRQLAAVLASKAYRDPVVLALPRGGLPVAMEVARSLAAPLDLIVVRKIGLPGRPELAAGAIVDGDSPRIAWNRVLMESENLCPSDLDAEVRVVTKELARRRRAYLGGRARASLEGRTAIIVDDGVATGTSLRAALMGLRRFRPRAIVVAVPVGSAVAIAKLAEVADEIVCLRQPEPFYGVGAHYVDFRQVSDVEVLALLDAAMRLRAEPQGAVP
ncbi:MAG: phosphoribosyltransferase family protein [Magnetospirillum sp.]|nr:phosphoribosyltransferase family protein [Magnetospirillum sp.]